MFWSDLVILPSTTYGGGIQSIIGVTGAHKASADAKTTIETRPLFAALSKSEKSYRR